MRLLRLADHLRADGLVVVEAQGWRARGVDFPARPDTIIAHHTATPDRAKGDLPTLRVLIDGRADLPGPLCQVALSRSGVVHMIAAGKANHAGRGAWRGQTSSASTIGVEAEHPGGDTPWPVRQYDAYVALTASLCRYLKVDALRVASHAEWALPAGRKTDPNFDMTRFREQVTAHLAPEDDEMTPADWQKFTTLLDDRLRIVLRSEKADGTPTGHPNLRDLAERLDRIEQALGSGQ